MLIFLKRFFRLNSDWQVFGWTLDIGMAPSHRIFLRISQWLAICLLLVFSYKYRFRILYYGQRLVDRVEDAVGPNQNHNLTSFGISLPGNFKVHGIDVSHHQHKINWEEVRRMKDSDDSISFVFMKATEGNFMMDSRFQENWENAHKQGILCGAYHYFKPKNDPFTQASLFCNTVSLRKGDLPPVLDIEDDQGLSPDLVKERAKEWLNEVERRLKVKPVIYTNYKFFSLYLMDSFDDYPLWIAHYYEPKLKIPNGKIWTLWQHNDRGKVNGIGGRVDFNVFNGSYKQLCSLCIH